MLGIKSAGWTTPFEVTNDAQPELRGECRRAPRIRDHIFMLYSLPESGLHAVEAITRNMSATGACIDVDREVPMGAELYIELYAPQDYHKKFLRTIYIKAAVVWQKALDAGHAGNMHRIGLSFTTIDKADQDTIYRYTEEGFVNRVNG
jgi:hypothetical protein